MNKIPFWVKLFAFFSITFFTTTAVVKFNQRTKRIEDEALRYKVQAEQDRTRVEQEARHRRAEQLAAEGFEKLRYERRKQLYLLCHDEGNYPLLFIDKVVCVKPESVVWSKYDGTPEQDTSTGGASSE